MKRGYSEILKTDMYRMHCPCGKEIEVSGTQAGCEVTCLCGKRLIVPTLRELKSNQEIKQATPVQHQPSDDEPSFHFQHYCGMVGQDGNVSELAMKHYVRLVHLEILAAIKSGTIPWFKDFIISVALAPGKLRRIELEVQPVDLASSEKELLCNRIGAIEPPLIHASPVAFGFFVTTQPGDKTQRSFEIFPSLTGSKNAEGIAGTLREAFGMRPVETTLGSEQPQTKRGSWWRRLIHGKRSTAPKEPSAREVFLLQEEWIKACEIMAAECSWIELKRALIDTPNESRYQVAYASKHAQQESWTLAAESFERLTSQFENMAPLFGRLAICQWNAGNSQAALVAYSKAIEKAPHEGSFRLYRSFIYQDLQACEQAERDLDEGVRLCPIDPEMFSYRALIRLQQNNTAGAMDDFQEAIRLDPNFGYAHFRLGWLYSCLEEDKVAAAIEHLTRAVDLNEQVEVRLYRSLAYLGQNKQALAMEDCECVLAIEPNNAFAHGVRGRILQSDGQYEEGIAACSRAIELGHEHPMVFLARAICYAATDQPTLAMSDCDVALALEPNNPWTIQFHGRLKLQSGDLDAAMEAFQRVLKLVPDWAEPREQISIVHRMKENPQASVDELTLLIERHPKQVSHYVHRAFAFTQLQEYQKAASDYDRAIELDPENDQLYFLRGNFRRDCQELELALADFERVMELQGDEDNARAHQASILMRLNRYQEAIDIFAKLIEKYPEHPYAYSGRAFASASLGNEDQAQEDAGRVMEMAPEMAGSVQRNTETANFFRLLRAQEYDAALEAAEKMMADYPDESIGYRLRARVHWDREEFVESVDDYTRALEIDGPTPECLSGRGQVQAELGEWELALEDLNQAVDLARQAGQTLVLAYALNGRSLAWAGMGRDTESERDFAESVSLCPTNPWVYYHRGIRMFQLDEPIDARVLLELALEFNNPPLSKRKQQRAKMALSKLASKQNIDPPGQQNSR